jgi:hypothetical protein
VALDRLDHHQDGAVQEDAADLPPFEDLLGFNPADPAHAYPEDPRGIIVRYGTGKGCREAP